MGIQGRPEIHLDLKSSCDVCLNKWVVAELILTSNISKNLSDSLRGIVGSPIGKHLNVIKQFITQLRSKGVGYDTQHCLSLVG
jgi:hypothetical protein